MNACVIGDLHLGGRHCDTQGLLAFLDALPDGCELILNGDTIDRYAASLDQGPVGTVLHRLAAESRRRRVQWLCGNHDRRPPALNTGGIVFDRQRVFPGRLLVIHGHSYGSVLFLARPFTALLRAAYALRVRLWGQPLDVAAYAKRHWMPLYQIIRHDVRLRAVRQARQAGCPAVVCGHSHYPEDAIVRGIRYMNPGAWTEKPVYAVWIGNESIAYRPCP